MLDVNEGDQVTFTVEQPVLNGPWTITLNKTGSTATATSTALLMKTSNENIGSNGGGTNSVYEYDPDDDDGISTITIPYPQLNPNNTWASFGTGSIRPYAAFEAWNAPSNDSTRCIMCNVMCNA